METVSVTTSLAWRGVTCKVVRAHQDGADVRSKPTSPAVPSPPGDRSTAVRAGAPQTGADPPAVRRSRVLSSSRRRGAGGDKRRVRGRISRAAPKSKNTKRVRAHGGIVRATVPERARWRCGPGGNSNLNVQISTPDLTVRTGAKVQTETRTGDAGATRTPHIRRGISAIYRYYGAGSWVSTLCGAYVAPKIRLVPCGL
jgi:hypothetical protein